MLKKLFILLLAISFSSLILANDNQISSIEVSGTQRIDVETVISYSKVKVGDTYTEDFGNNILKDLFETNLFSNIEISFNNNNLNVVKEGIQQSI